MKIKLTQDTQYHEAQGGMALVYSGRTLIEIYREIGCDLSVGGRRCIHVAEDWDQGRPIGREVCHSLYGGESYIRDAAGREIYRS